MPAIVNLLFNVVSTNTTISFTVVLPMFSLLSLLAGVGGHVLLWVVVVTNPNTRSKPSSVLLLNLSLADLGALLTLPCVLFSASFQNWELGGGTCVLLGFMTSVTVGVEIFSLAALSVLRYRIVAPPRRPPATLIQMLCTVGTIWLVSLTMALPKVTYINFDGGCTWAVSRDEWLYFLVPAFLVYYVAPLLCIAVNCGLIISHLHHCRGATLAADRRNKKATALLVASTVLFAISWLPYYALEFVNVLSSQVSSAAFPVHGFARQRSSVSSLLYLTTSPQPTEETPATVSIFWEVASLVAILLVCFAPCWNPPLYFLLSRPAVRQLQALLPSSIRERTQKKKNWKVWRISPAPPDDPHPPARSLTLTHTSLRHRLTQ